MASNMKALADFFAHRENAIKQQFRDAVDEAQKNAYKDWFKYTDEHLREQHKKVAKKFYDDYPDPEYYDRRGSLYDLYSSEIGDDYITAWFDETKMYSAYNDYTMKEDGLFDKVFVQGYHGGAERGPSHPHPGTPYWRAPHPYYYYWSRPAEKMSPSPYDEFMKVVSVYNGEEFDDSGVSGQDEFNRIFQEYIDKIKI